MEKRACNCPNCKARNLADFIAVVSNPANGQWFEKLDNGTDDISLQERLEAYSMKA